MNKLLSAAIAVLLAVASGFSQTPASGSKTVTGTSSQLNGIGNTAVEIIHDQAGNRLWAEVVNNHGTNDCIVDIGVPTLVTTVVGSTTYTNWSGTVLKPGGSFILEPKEGKRFTHPHAVYIVIIGIGTNSIGWREITE